MNPITFFLIANARRELVGGVLIDSYDPTSDFPMIRSYLEHATGGMIVVNCILVLEPSNGSFCIYPTSLNSLIIYEDKDRSTWSHQDSLQLVKQLIYGVQCT